jgi:hypothetical protein
MSKWTLRDPITVLADAIGTVASVWVFERVAAF